MRWEMEMLGLRSRDTLLRIFSSTSDSVRCARDLCRRVDVRMFLVTLSHHGITVTEMGNDQWDDDGTKEFEKSTDLTWDHFIMIAWHPSSHHTTSLNIQFRRKFVAWTNQCPISIWNRRTDDHPSLSHTQSRSDPFLPRSLWSTKNVSSKLVLVSKTQLRLPVWGRRKSLQLFTALCLDQADGSFISLDSVAKHTP